MGSEMCIRDSNWFGGVYIDKNQFFARMGIDAETYFDVYPELGVSDQELADFKKERNACIIGEDIAIRYNLEIGDIMPMEGDIYPGQWEFVVRGIYKPKNTSVDATQMLFHWDYLNQRIEQNSPNRANDVGWYIVKIENPEDAGMVSERVDALFENSAASTKTETERAFQQGFVSASGAILTAMNVMSFLIIGIIMLVLGNTMIMAARERTREYAVFKALGFSGKHLAGIIMGESLFISLLGGALGMAIVLPLISGFEAFMPKGWFPVFQMEPVTTIMALSAVFLIGLIAALFPIRQAMSTKIIDGFRFVG